MKDHYRWSFVSLVLLVAARELSSSSASSSSSSSSYRRFLKDYKIEMVDPAIWTGNAILLRCSNQCHKQSCKFWTWNPDTLECLLYPTSKVNTITSVAGTAFEHYIVIPDTGTVMTDYVAFPFKGTWELAKQICQSEGAILAYYPDSAELKTFMQASGATGFFTGIHRFVDDNSTWYDEEGNDMSSQLLWTIGQPNSDDQLCTAFFGSGLDDVRCDTDRAVSALCKQKKKI